MSGGGWYRWLLHLYPRAFRDQFGAEMIATFIAALESRPTRAARLGFAVRAIADAVASATHEHLDDLRRRRPAHRDSSRRDSLLRTVLWDARTAARSLRRRPAFVIAVVGTLSLGIGANTAVFSLIDAVLLRPLPVTDPERLVAVHLARNAELVHEPMQYELFRTIETRARDRMTIAGFHGMEVGVKIGGRADQIHAAVVSGSYFPLLGIHAQRGRLIQPDDDRTIGAHPVVVLSDEAWARYFDRSPSAVGATLRAGDVVYTIIGVTPRGFRGTRLTQRPMMWFPIAMATSVGDGGLFSRRNTEQIYTTNAFGWVDVIGRITDARSVNALERDLSAMFDDYARDHALNAGERGDVRQAISLMPLTRAAVLRGREDVVRFVSILLAVVGFTLLVACVNVANLMLARSAERQKELSVRSALGASRARLARQLLLESAILAGAGALLGIVVGTATMRVLSAFTLPGQIALDGVGLRLDGRVLAFTSLTAIASAMVFGLLPSITASREQPIGALRVHGYGGARGPRYAFLSVQIALSLVMLVAASLFARSLQAGLRSDIGFDPRPLATVAVDLPRNGYTKARVAAYYESALARARALPGVTGAAIAGHVPLASIPQLPFAPGGTSPSDPKAREVRAGMNEISPDYFEVIGVPLVGGRAFTAADDDAAPRVAIVNESAARMLSPDADILGRELMLLRSIAVRVVGIVRDTKYESLLDDGVPVVFVPIAQQPALGSAKIVVRSARPAQTVAELRRAIVAIDTDMPVLDASLVTDQVDAVLMPQRFGATLLGMFALITLGVTAVGVYGVAAYGVNRRITEIGIRLALGARTADIVRTVLGRSGVAVAIGVMAGGLGAAFATRAVEQFLVDVRPNDPLSFGAAFAALVLAAFLASWLPARRAARVDPTEAIRGQGVG